MIRKVLISAFTLAAAVAVSALAQAQTPAKSPTDIDSVRSSPARDKGGWTRAKREQARPMPLPQLDPSLRTERMKRADPPAKQERLPGQKEAGGAPVATPITDKRIAGNVAAVPLRWAGQLFADTGSGSASCSAQFIRPNVILTAAHCVRDQKTGKFFTNMRFYQQRAGRGFETEYGYECVGTLNGWITLKGIDAFEYDFAMLHSSRPSVTGSFGWWANSQGLVNQATSIGYPGAISGGAIIQVEQGRVVEINPEKKQKEGLGILRMTHGNPKFTQGSSGGAWVADYASTPTGNRAISVNSFGFPDEPGNSYGPYFGEPFQKLVRYVENRCR